MAIIKEKEYKKSDYHNIILVGQYALFFCDGVDGLESEVISLLGCIRVCIWDNYWHNMCDEMFGR